MPLEGIFIEPATTTSNSSVPDLSLHISLPNSSSSSICNTISDVHKSTSSFKNQTSQLSAYTELSLTHPVNRNSALNELETTHHSRRNFRNGRAQEEQPQNPFHHHHLYQPNNSQLNHINNGVSLLDVSDGFRPIKGIPVYHNRSFPFSPPLDHHHGHARDKLDPKMCFYPISNYPNSSVSPSPSPYFGANLDHMSSIINSGPNNASSLAANRTPGATRFNGLSSSSYHHQHHNQFGVGPSHEASHGMMRSSRFLPKLPAKRSMRAPRMRWTSTLHARFVHAVEHLGGHESN